MSLKGQLSNLHLLLRVPSFARWPLRIRFFCEDVYEAWLKWANVADAPLRQTIKIILDFDSPKEGRQNHPDLVKSGFEKDETGHPVSIGVQSIDPTYGSMKAYVEKSQNLAQGAEQLTCSCCGSCVNPSKEMMLVCAETDCRAVSHVACLSKAFLKATDGNEVIPIEGQCPTCKANIQWSELVKELTLRMRGQKEVARLLKPKRRKVGRTEVPLQEEEEEEEEVEPEDDLEDDLSVEDVIDEPKKYEANDAALEDTWETSSVSTVASEEMVDCTNDSNRRDQARDRRLSPVIEDSDGWEGVHILD